ncbi:hypothetical protein [Psychrobacter ciconiae]|uniref:hypothetical protein n=1 Tax=Psychrobacter ciconiae TaxID=1553449 RepID=UPI00191AFBE0|nr:hypothetical protein [Psychrobacter ciconiae]
MIDGIWWLVILIVVIIALWLVAKRRGDDKNETLEPKTNLALQKTARLIEQSFAEFRLTQKPNHLIVSKSGQKIAMITMDKKVAAGQRKLGDALVLNYHKTPSAHELTRDLT